MRVLVTGGAGFIGSHIVDALLAKGYTTAVLDNLSTGHLANINPGANFYKGDLRDADFVGETLQAERPHWVIHQAAQSNVQKSVADPGADAAANIMGTINLLEACRHQGVKKVVYASSAAVYGNPRYLPVDENHPLQPLSGYGVSKLTVEYYLEVYRVLYGLDYTALRYANVYGPRQVATGEGGVVSIFVDRLLRGRPPFVFGDGQQTRDFIFVEDVVRANLAALTQGGGGVFNVSTGKPTSVNQMLATLQQVTGSGLDPEYQPPRSGDIEHSYLAARAASDGIDWQALWDLAQGLERTVELQHLS